MKKVLIRATALGLLPLLGAGADAATNLVQNGSFSQNTLPFPLNPSGRRFADRRPGAVDLGDDAGRFWRTWGYAAYRRRTPLAVI